MLVTMATQRNGLLLHHPLDANNFDTEMANAPGGKSLIQFSGMLLVYIFLLPGEVLVGGEGGGVGGRR